jgi:hypothetical protein
LRVEFYINTESALSFFFEPGDGTAYEVHMQEDIHGGVLIASTRGSKGLYRWFPEDGEVKIIYASHAAWFADHFDAWMNQITLNGETISMIAEQRWRL